LGKNSLPQPGHNTKLVEYYVYFCNLKNGTTGTVAKHLTKVKYSYYYVDIISTLNDRTRQPTFPTRAKTVNCLERRAQDSESDRKQGL